MNRDEPRTNPETLRQRVTDQPKRPKWKWVLPLALGFLAVPLGIFLGEVFGDFAMFIGLAPYFLLSQYLLSRANPQAACFDWASAFSLNAGPILATGLQLIEKFVVSADPARGLSPVGVLEMLGLPLCTLACCWVGAALATRTARQRLP